FAATKIVNEILETTTRPDACRWPSAYIRCPAAKRASIDALWIYATSPEAAPVMVTHCYSPIESPPALAVRASTEATLVGVPTAFLTVQLVPTIPDTPVPEVAPPLPLNTPLSHTFSFAEFVP